MQARAQLLVGLLCVAACGGSDKSSPIAKSYTVLTAPSDVTLAATSAPVGQPLVAVGAGGAIFANVSGSLERQNSNTTVDLAAVTWNAGTYYAVGDGTLLASSDAANWLADPAATNNDALFTIVNVGAAEYIVGANGNVYESGGTAWADSPILDVALTSAALWQSTFVVSGTDDSANPPNGVLYATSTAGALGAFNLRASHLPTFVAIASPQGSGVEFLAIATQAIYASADGVNFSEVYADNSEAFYALTCCEGRCFAVGQDSESAPLVRRSEDAAHAIWLRDSLPANAADNLLGASCNGPALVAAGTHGVVLISPDESGVVDGGGGTAASY